MPLDVSPLVYVMGPSGAGKDSVLRFARVNLSTPDKIAFAHRYITRPPEISGENHVALTRPEFEARQGAGLFAFDWEAHQTCYGVGIEIETWRTAGFVVVMNGSRNHFAKLSAQSANIVPVLITASPQILATRLARRGRESEPEVIARMQREAVLPADRSITVIDNSGPIEIAGSRFVELLRRLARMPVHA